MTPTPRERFEEEFGHIDEMMMIPPKEMILEFVDALLEEARQDGREEMKQMCLSCIPTNLVGTAGMMVQIEQDLIRERISSL